MKSVPRMKFTKHISKQFNQIMQNKIREAAKENLFSIVMTMNAQKIIENVKK